MNDDELERASLAITVALLFRVVVVLWRRLEQVQAARDELRNRIGWLAPRWRRRDREWDGGRW